MTSRSRPKRPPTTTPGTSSRRPGRWPCAAASSISAGSAWKSRSARSTFAFCATSTRSCAPMQRRRELLIAVGVAALGSMRADGEPAADGSRAGNPLDLGEFGKRKEPIFITSDNLEYDYKTNVVVYHGDVHAIQGPVTLRSDTLTITLEKTDQDGSSDAPKSDPPRGDSPKSNPRLRQIVAAGRVHMDDGTRSATGGRAVFEQSERTVVLTENPVLHEGSNEVV